MQDEKPSTWASIRHYVQLDGEVVDPNGVVWRRRFGRYDSDILVRVDDPTQTRKVVDRDLMSLPTPPIPEPPDGTRIEFEHNTDLYAAWRHDASSERAGWPAGHGWLLYGHDVPCSWAAMYAQFGDSLATAVRLAPLVEDLPKHEQWPTRIWARRRAAEQKAEV